MRADGFKELSGGIDSGKHPSIQSAINPNGLKHSQLAYAVNATMRGGAVTTRPAWVQRPLTFADGALETAWMAGRFQHADDYEPDSDLPFLLAVVNGVLHKIDVSNYAVTDVGIAGDPNSPVIAHNWSAQAENYWVLQDNQAQPLIFDGTTSRRAVAGEVRTGQMMEYYMGRLWVARSRQFRAGDIVGGPSGTLANQFRDAVIKDTENTYLTTGGGSFFVPSNAGAITAVHKTINNDSALGEGELLVMTRNTIYSVRVPATRTDWIALKEPLQRIIQHNFGATAQDSITVVNGDLFYRSKDGFRSLYMAKREFIAWGNTPISNEMKRAMSRDDRALLEFGSSALFDNRFIGTISPVRTDYGIYHRALAVLDFDLISGMAEKLPPAWEGSWTGLKVLKLVEMDYGGRDRLFAFVLNDEYHIELWELTTSERFDNEVNRITMAIETPRYDFGNPFELKDLDHMELWVSRLAGNVEFTVQWKPDNYPCWIDWRSWTLCAPKSTCDDPNPPEGCFMFQDYREQFRTRLVVGQPPDTCDPISHRPFRRFYEAQFRIQVHGHATINQMRVFANEHKEAQYTECLT